MSLSKAGTFGELENILIEKVWIPANLGENPSPTARLGCGLELDGVSIASIQDDKLCYVMDRSSDRVC